MRGGDSRGIQCSSKGGRYTTNRVKKGEKRKKTTFGGKENEEKTSGRGKKRYPVTDHGEDPAPT